MGWKVVVDDDGEGFWQTVVLDGGNEWWCYDGVVLVVGDGGRRW